MSMVVCVIVSIGLLIRAAEESSGWIRTIFKTRQMKLFHNAIKRQPPPSGFAIGVQDTKVIMQRAMKYHL